MANNFVKWWKNKFLNSYKQFADANFGKISDTEELLGSISLDSDRESQFRISCTTPSIGEHKLQCCHEVPEGSNTSNHNQSCPHPTNDNFKFEQFSCDVSMEDGVDKKGQQRQEFSFTLYDFDGYGKITKDDIAGLVTTIYEALGSSVKVPHYGSKTIRVKLTVSPEQRKHVSATVVNNDTCLDCELGKTDLKTECSEHNSQTDRYKNDLNITIGQRNNKSCGRTASSGKNQKCRQHRCCRILENYDKHSDCLNVSDDQSDISSISSGDATCEDGRDMSDFENKCAKVRKKIYVKKSRRRRSAREAPNDSNDPDSIKFTKKQMRSSSLQRQELLEIIQANMDKNNLCLKDRRKQDDKNTDVKHSIKSRRSQKSRVPSTLQYLANIMDPTHFYVDLASFQNATQLPNNNIQYNKLIDAVMCVSNRRAPLKKVQPYSRKHKSKTFDGSTVLQNGNASNLCQNNDKVQKRPKISEMDSKPYRRNVKKIPQIVLGNTSSPHYLKHRNRQEDQARAMAQVVRWLEQEFSSNFYTKECYTKKKEKLFEKKTNCESTSAPTSTVERHEHHHVHEHVHHHYHHYQDTPIVV